MILYIRHTRLACAIGATVEGVVGLDAVSDDLAASSRADRCEFVNCALEAIERVACASRHDFKGQVIIVTTHLTLRHLPPPFTAVMLPRLVRLFSGYSLFEQLDYGGVPLLRRKQYGVLVCDGEISVQVGTFIK
jgi:hypothetical protein